MLSTAGGQLPCPLKTACVVGPFAGRHACWRVPPGAGHNPQVVHDILPWGARSGLSVTRARCRLQDPSLVALPLALAAHGSWRVLQLQVREEHLCCPPRGGQLPCPLKTACVVGPFAGRHACWRVPPGAGHNPQVVHDILPWGARSGLSVTRARCRLQDPSLVALPLALAPHGSWRVPPGIGHHPQAWEGSARHRAPPTSCRGGRNTCAVHRGGAAPLSSSIPCRPSLPAPCSLLPTRRRGVKCPKPVCDPGTALAQDPVPETSLLDPVTQFSPQAAPTCQCAYGPRQRLAQAGSATGGGGWLLMPRLPPGARVGR